MEKEEKQPIDYQNAVKTLSKLVGKTIWMKTTFDDGQILLNGKFLYIIKKITEIKWYPDDVIKLYFSDGKVMSISSIDQFESIECDDIGEYGSISEMVRDIGIKLKFPNNN